MCVSCSIVVASVLVGVGASAGASAPRIDTPPVDAPPADASLDPLRSAWERVAAAHLAGRDSSSALRSLRDQYGTFFSTLLMADDGATDPQVLTRMRDRDLADLDARIAAAEEREEFAWWFFQQVITSGLDDTDPAGPAEIDDRVTDLSDRVLGPDASESALDVLTGRVPFVVTDGSSVVSSMPGRLYDLGAGLPANALAPAPSATTDTAVRRPVRFTNTGDTAATVRVATYEPSVDAVGAVASTASTVVFPAGGTSAVLELPVGAYTFCYEWPLDGDADGDGRVDLAHAVTGTVSIGVDSPVDPGTATAATISPLSTQTANGRCGEATTTGQNAPSVVDGGPSQATTPAEAANDGRHTFDLVVIWDDGERSETVSVTVDLVFTATGLTVSGADAEALLGQASLTLDRTGPNTFFTANPDGAATVEVTEAGATVVVDYGEFFGVATYVLTRTS